MKKKGKWDETIVTLSDAIEYEPGNSNLFKRLAKAHEQLGNVADAEKTYQMGLQSVDQPEEFQFLLVSLYNRHKRHDDVVQAAASYFENYPDGRNYSNIIRYKNEAQEAIALAEEKAAIQEKRRQGLEGATRRRMYFQK